MMPLSFILSKYTVSDQFKKLLEKINHLVYMDDIRIFSKNEKELGGGVLVV